MNEKTNDSPKTKGVTNPYVILGFSLWLLYGFGYEALYQRLITQVEGVVVSSRDFRSPGNPRYVTEYVFRTRDGRETRYVAGPTDASLAQSMPVGTTISKKKWHLDYERDGEHVSDFPTAVYGLTLAVAVAALIWSIRLWRQE